MNLLIIGAVILFTFFSLNSFAHQEHKHHKHRSHGHETHKHEPREHGVHQHGSGTLNLVLEGEKLQISTEIPAHDLVGFESLPTKPAQKNKLKNVVEILKDYNQVLTLPKASKCQLSEEASIQSDLLTSDTHTKKSSHASFEVQYNFLCQNPKGLSLIVVNLFKKFKSVQNLKVQGLTDSGPLSVTLTPKQNSIKVKP